MRLAMGVWQAGPRCCGCICCAGGSGGGEADELRVTEDGEDRMTENDQERVTE